MQMLLLQKHSSGMQWIHCFFLLQMVFLQHILSSRLIGTIPYITGDDEDSVRTIQTVKGGLRPSLTLCWYLRIESQVLSSSLWTIISWNPILKPVFMPWPPFPMTVYPVAFSTWCRVLRLLFIADLWTAQLRFTGLGEATRKTSGVHFWSGCHSVNIITSHWGWAFC